MAIVLQGWGTPFDPVTAGYGAFEAAGCPEPARVPAPAWPGPYFQPRAVQILRPPPPGGGKIGEPAPTGQSAQLLIQPHPQLEPITLDPDGRMYYNHAGYTLPGPAGTPDIREQDRLRDPCDTDPRTHGPVEYIVRAVFRYGGSHLEMFAQRPLGA